ncbi:MAG: metallophosphoesterase family protein [Bacteroidota bacterium]
MNRIGLLSDTHGTLEEPVVRFLSSADEIWHAGDIGNLMVINKLKNIAPVVAVHGNIDGTELRETFPENQIFGKSGVKVVMKHIGGYPGRYERGVSELLTNEKPHLFISGHSHILKVIHDKKLDILHMNPGSCGNTGLHKVKTAIRFIIDKGMIRDLEVLEVPRK